MFIPEVFWYNKYKRHRKERKHMKSILIDGNSLIYRTFYGIREMSNSKGVPTNAIYGFVNILVKIQEE